MFDDRLKTAVQLAKEATTRDSKGEYEKALSLYKLSLENWKFAAKNQKNASIKEKLLLKMQEYVERAEKISAYLQNKKDEENHIPETLGGASDEKEKLKLSFLRCVTIEKPNVKWSDVAGLEFAKDCLQEAVILPTAFPVFFSEELRPWKGILLYGPPGTGKTHLARACATESSATFISVSSADLFSKWQGESEKLVRALFETAREQKPSVIFIDEIDSMCSSRGGPDSDSSRRVKTEFLVQMQGLSNDAADGMLVLGATNTPWEIDPGIRRRFERRIYIPLPNQRSRRRLFVVHLGRTSHDMTDEHFELLASRTSGFSGADISVLVRDALYQPMRKCRLATHFKLIIRNGVEGWTPCAPADPDFTKEEMILKEVPSGKLHPPIATLRDFIHALETTSASVGPDDLEKHEEWAKKFGNSGGELSE